MLLLKVNAPVPLPLHTVKLAGTVTTGGGLTVILKFDAVPLQPLADGVTVIVPVIAADPLLVAINAAILPVPVEASPIPVLLFIQVYVAPATELPKVSVDVSVPLHKVWLKPPVTVGVGFTYIEKLVVVPVQLLAVGVTVIVPAIVDAPVFVAVNDAILPLPVDARPIEVLLFIHV
jgi:hypothetical protein